MIVQFVLLSCFINQHVMVRMKLIPLCGFDTPCGNRLIITKQALHTEKYMKSDLHKARTSKISNTLLRRHIVGTMASQITTRDCLLNRSFGRRSKKTSLASLAFVRGIHRWPVNSPHKWPVTRKMFPFDDVIMTTTTMCTRRAGCGR